MDEENTPDYVGEVTHKVKLGDKLDFNGMIFIITSVNKRLFQSGVMTVKSIEEFMSEMTEDA